MRFLLVLSFAVLAACGETAPPSGVLSPADVQGPGDASRLAGEIVSVRGVVSGDFQDGDADDSSKLGGFFLQSIEADEDPRTSEGLFVFEPGGSIVDVATGDVVQVRGEVVEHFGETQLKAQEVAVEGSRAPRAVELALPAARTGTNADGEFIADLEAFEGMLVRVAAMLYVQDLRGLGRYGELGLSTEAREYQFTNVSLPDRAAYAAHREARAARSLLLDDGLIVQNAWPPRYLAAAGLAGRPPRVGDALADLVGVLRYSRGSGPNGRETWRLMPTAPPRFVPRNPRPAAPAAGDGVVVASVNLLNYFSTVDDGEPVCGPARADGCRGADSAAELDRQRARTATAIRALGADIVGLMELENNARSAIADLVAALNAAGGDWAFVDTGTLGDDAIRVALIYRAGRVEPVGRHAVLDGSVDARFNDARNRPVLAQTFAAAGGRFTVAVNHLKSKGSDCDEDGDPDRADGQGNCNGTRTRAAAALADWLAGDPTGSGDPDALVIGDLNAYLREDPVRALEGAGFVNLLARDIGTSAYSFVFDGASGALDHALASPSLAAQVTQVQEWHINADEAPLLDYNLEFGRDPALFDPAAPWRAADHDPLVVVIEPVSD